MDAGIGIVGTGFGCDVCVPALRNVEGVEVVGVAASRATSSEEAAETHGIPYATGDWEELLRHPAVDIVLVATPPDIRPKIAVEAIREGHQVVLEKPMATDRDGANAIARAAEDRDASHAVDFLFRYSPALQYLREWIRDRPDQSIRHVEVNWITGGRADPTQRWDWRSSRARGGGILTSLGAHVLDYLAWIFGPIGKVQSRLHRTVQRRPTPQGDGERDVTAAEAAHVHLEVGAGVPVSLTLSQVAPRGTGHRIEVHGEKETLVLENPEVTSYSQPFEARRAEYPSLDFEAVTLPDLDYERYPDDRCALFARLFQAWRRGGSDEAPTLEDGLRTQEALEAVRRSARDGRPVTVGADNEDSS